MLIVVAIIGLLGTLVLPVYGRVVEKAKRNALAADGRVIFKALKQYYVDNNTYPPDAAFDRRTLEPLVSQGYLSKAAASSFLGKLDGTEVEVYWAVDFISPDSQLLIRMRPKYDVDEWVYILDLNVFSAFWDGVYFRWNGQIVTADQVK
jgi:competence protein ComGC